MRSIYLSFVAITLFVGRDVAVSAEPVDGQAKTIKLLDQQVIPIA